MYLCMPAGGADGARHPLHQPKGRATNNLCQASPERKGHALYAPGELGKLAEGVQCDL
jgi:hypothetical protein